MKPRFALVLLALGSAALLRAAEPTKPACCAGCATEAKPAVEKPCCVGKKPTAPAVSVPALGLTDGSNLALSARSLYQLESEFTDAGLMGDVSEAAQAVRRVAASK